MKQFSVLRILGVSALALLLGLATPLTIALSFWMLIPSVAFMFLYALGGPVPAAVHAAVTLGMMYLIGDTGAAAVSALVFFLPCIVTLRVLYMRRSYLSVMRISVTGFLAAAVAAMLIIYSMIHANIVDALVTYFEQMLNAAPSPMMDQLLLYYGQSGLLPSGTMNIDFTKGFLEAAERVTVLHAYLANLGESLKDQVVGLMLTGCISTGIIAVALPVYMWARRGDDLGARRMPINEWRAPKNAAIGIPMCLALCYILYACGMTSANAAYIALMELGMLLAKIQGLGSASRAFKRSGTSRGIRITLIVLTLLFAPSVLTVIGIASAYLGSQGLITNYLKKKKKDREGDE